MASSIAPPPSVLVRCKGILFDMDGILISSLGAVERSWTKWALMRGIDPAHACRTTHGCRSIETVAKLRPDLDSETENKLIEDLEIGDTKGISALPGVLELLAALPPNRWIVVTSATERLTRVRLRAAGISVPQHLITADSVVQGKPDPAPFLAGATLLGFAPEDCVVFEDAPSGVQAGRAAGCKVVATTFSHPIEALAAAHYLIEGASSVEVVSFAENGGMILKLTLLAK